MYNTLNTMDKQNVSQLMDLEEIENSSNVPQRAIRQITPSSRYPYEQQQRQSNRYSPPEQHISTPEEYYKSIESPPSEYHHRISSYESFGFLL